LFGKLVRFEKPAGSVQVKGDTVRVSGFTVQTMGGGLEGDLKLTQLHNDPSYELNARWKGVEFGSVAEAYQVHQLTGGVLSGSVHLEGRGPRLEAIKGGGEAVIVDGDVFAVPGLSSLLRPVADQLSTPSPG